MHALDLTLRAGGAVLIVLLGSLIVWRNRATLAGWLAGALALTVASHLLCPHVLRSWGVGWVTGPVLLACIGVPAAFWLFTSALFDDRFRLRAWHALPLLLLLAAGTAEAVVRAAAPQPPAALLATLAVSSRVIAIGLIVAALARALAGHAADLLDARRRLRGWLVGLAAAYMIAVVAVELHLRGEAAPAALSALSAGLIVLLAVLFGAALLLAGPLTPAQTASSLDVADDALRQRLHSAIETQRVYRREGLTIARLAAHLAVPEYRLRRVVNRTLGFRNFSDFLNHYRIRDARDALEDPARAAVPILTVALELGYQSLSPFNRAFKAQTGLTPSAYRRSKQANDRAGLTDS